MWTVRSEVQELGLGCSGTAGSDVFLPRVQGHGKPVCGIVNQLYTMHIYYIYRSPLITATQAWVFPSEYAPILAYDVCELLKAGIDSDTVNAAQAVANGRTSAIIYSQMSEWDNDLSTDSIEGATYGDIGGDASFLSRTVPGTNNSF